MNQPKRPTGRPRRAEFAAHDARRVANLTQQVHHYLYSVLEELTRHPEMFGALSAAEPLYMKRLMRDAQPMMGAMRAIRTVVLSRQAAGLGSADG